MQKKIIALAVVGLMSGTAFAAGSSVTVGGKFDACYAFQRKANNVTTEVQKDGCNSTSRVSIGAKENIAKGYDIRVDFDIRFASNNVHEGKTGLASNDKKAMAFTTPFGTIQWGVANLQSNDYKLSQKPYMVSPSDTELVKFGISQWRETSLTNRNTSYWSPVLSVGPVQALVKGTIAFGDNQKSGANDASTANSGNVLVLGHEGKLFGGIADYAVDVTKRGATTSEGGATGGAFVFNHYYVNVRPIPGNKNLKLSAQYNVYKGWEGANGAAVGGNSFKDKNTNFVVSYNFNGKAEVGLGVSHTNAVGTTRASGRGIMLGGSYFLSKSVQVYSGLSTVRMSSGAGYKGYRFDGTATGFAATRTFDNDRTVKVGILKTF